MHVIPTSLFFYLNISLYLLTKDTIYPYNYLIYIIMLLCYYNDISKYHLQETV